MDLVINAIKLSLGETTNARLVFFYKSGHTGVKSMFCGGSLANVVVRYNNIRSLTRRVHIYMGNVG